jgi:hypothetical protein
MPEQRNGLAHDIVTTILRDLKGRSGLGDELSSIDRDTYEEMYEDLVTLTRRLLDAQLS